jgi:WXG100 family type VII secretion target
MVDGLLLSDHVTASGFGVAPEELQACGARLGQISEDVVAEMHALTGEMDALLGSGWQGSAADGFAQGWEEWLAGARDVLEGLSEMGRLLGETGRNYTTTDDASAGTIDRSGAGS